MRMAGLARLAPLGPEMPNDATNNPAGFKAPTGAIQVGLRPEHTKIVAKGASIMQGRIVVAEYTGSSTLLHVSLEDGHSCLVTLEGEAPSTGTIVDLMVASSRLHFFDADGRACAA